MAAIGVPSDAKLAQAETALDVWREVPTAKAIFLREGRSAESIESGHPVHIHSVALVPANRRE